jgi:hypothetical protein
MKKPNVVCPACKEISIQQTTGDYVVLCSLVYEQYVSGQSNFESYFIVPSNCEEDKYTKCVVWREEKEEDWMQKLGEKHSSLKQQEQIRL